MKVFKFGGASVKNAAGIRNLIHIVSQETDRLAVVVSAMGKTTNALEKVVNALFAGDESVAMAAMEEVRDFHYNIAQSLYEQGYRFLQNKIDGIISRISSIINKEMLLQTEGHPTLYDELYDQIVSFGEILSTTIISVALNREGIVTHYVDMTRCLRTDNTFREAKIDMHASAELLQREWKRYDFPVHILQGFIGGTEDGCPTTLGREGSDYTAAIVANLLEAESVTIWKDVPGILNADPRIFDHTTLIPRLTYYDAVELAYSGAQVIHPKTIRPLENKHIPLYVRPFADYNATGSVIQQTTPKPIDVPVFIWRKNQVLITVRPKDFSFILEDGLNHLFDVVCRHRLKVSLIQSSAITISVCVDNSRYLEHALQELQADYRVTFNSNLSLLTIRGTTPEIIRQQTEGKTILLSQTTRHTARYVIVD